MNIAKKIYTPLLLLAIAATLPLQSCFTGVEGTKKITLSKKDLQTVGPTADESFLADITVPTIGEWHRGRRFLVADEKFTLLTESNGATIREGDILTFREVKSGTNVDGSEKAIIMFDGGSVPVTFPLEKTRDAAMASVRSSDIPLLLDLDLVGQIRGKLLGKEIWTRTASWLDDSLKYKKGKKFQAVRVTDVKPGNAFFPILVEFIATDGSEGKMLMNFGNAGNESRSFAKLFSLHDLRNDYKNISDENWSAIMDERVRLGMTKEECRLAIGSPIDVDMGHDYSTAVEIWRYSDSSYLRFLDGVLVNFK